MEVERSGHTYQISHVLHGNLVDLPPQAGICTSHFLNTTFLSLFSGRYIKINAGRSIISTNPPSPSCHSRLAQDYAIHVFTTWVFHLTCSCWISLRLWSFYASVPLQTSADRAVDNWTRSVGTIPGRLHYTCKMYALVYLLHSHVIKAKCKPECSVWWEWWGGKSRYKVEVSCWRNLLSTELEVDSQCGLQVSWLWKPGTELLWNDSLEGGGWQQNLRSPCRLCVCLAAVFLAHQGSNDKLSLLPWNTFMRPYWTSGGGFYTLCAFPTAFSLRWSLSGHWHCKSRY